MGLSGSELEELAAVLTAKAGDRHCVTGLTDAELFELERGLGGMRLPLAYREFMRRMGRDAGPLLAGTDAFYPQIIEYQEDAWSLVSEGRIEHLAPVGSIIFAIHQGYQIYWMSSRAGEDPPVFMYQEGDSEICLTWESFSDFISDEFSKVS